MSTLHSIHGHSCKRHNESHYHITMLESKLKNVESELKELLEWKQHITSTILGFTTRQLSDPSNIQKHARRASITTLSRISMPSMQDKELAKSPAEITTVKALPVSAACKACPVASITVTEIKDPLEEGENDEDRGTSVIVESKHSDSHTALLCILINP